LVDLFKSTRRPQSAPALGKQAKVVKRSELGKLLDHVSRSRHPERDRVIVLLSFKAGLRAKEIAALSWSMLTDSSGEIADVIALTNSASKGKNGGREIPMHPDLRSALVALQAARGEKARPDLLVVYSERGRGYSAAAIAVWFHTRFAELRIEGASSHSGRRTFITAARHDRGLARFGSRLGGHFRTVIAASAHALAYMAGKQESSDPGRTAISGGAAARGLEQPLTSYLQQMWARFPAASENWAAVAEME
jgi:integrase